MITESTSKKSKAFTLIEVLVAMLVLAIGLLGLAAITVVVLKSNTTAQQISEATNIASALMEDLRRTTTLPDCVAANALSFSDSNCEIFTESGLRKSQTEWQDVDDGFAPPGINNQTECGIPNVMGNPTNAVTFDAVAGNYLDREDFDLVADVCDASSPPAGHPYIRYYRTVTPTGGTGTDRRIYVVVLWKDKYGKWRHVKLETQRLQ